jgi:hypothetical protein
LVEQAMIFPGSGTAFPEVCLDWIKEDWREEAVPLSEEELRLLEQMERALVAEDPKFASALRGTTLRRNARRRSYIAAAVFFVGVVVLMTGAVMQQTVVGIIGFVVMLGSAYVALTSWRGQNSATAHPEEGHEVAGPSTQQFGFSVIEGGKAGKRGRRFGRGRKPRSHQPMMERFEERWRRRREGNGF